MEDKAPKVKNKACNELRHHEDHLWETPTDYHWCSGIGYDWYVGGA